MTLPLSVLGQQFVAGRRVASGEATLPNLHVTDGRLTEYHFYPASHEEAAAVVEAADRVFPVYSQTAPDVRARFLDTLADKLDLLGEDFFAIAHQEAALPLARLRGECTRTNNQLRMFAGVLRRGNTFGVRIDTALPDRQLLPRPDLRQYLTALGPVAVFGASGFPLAFSTVKGGTASALAADCPVVVKAHPGHMATAKLAARAIVHAVTVSSLPAGVFNMIFGADIGAGLVRHPTTQAMGFTSSLRGSRTLWQLVQQRPQPIPAFAGMSVTNPLIILPQAIAMRAETLINELVSSFTLGCGQFCTKPGLILVLHGEGISHFTQALKVMVDQAPAQIILSAPTLAHCEEGVSVLEAHPHTQRLAGSNESVTSRVQARLYQAPASLLLTQDPLLRQGVPDPLTVLIEVVDGAELQSILRVTPDQLTATMRTESDDGPLAQRLLPALIEKAGHVLLSGYLTGVKVCSAMVHGGPWPATTDAHGTSVGTQSIDRFLYPVCLQNVSATLLPPAIRDDNPLNLLRLIDGQQTREATFPSVD